MQHRRSMFDAFFQLCRLVFWLCLATWRIRVARRRSIEHCQQAMSRISQDLLHILDIRVTVKGDPSHHGIKGPILYASNHISWIDPFILQAVIPSSFIAKMEIYSFPIIGRIAKSCPSIIPINRSCKRDILAVNQVIAKTLESGQSVAFFPEGTTSDGRDILPFKASLFQSAIDGKAALQVAAIRYTQRGEYTNIPAYVGDRSLMAILWDFIRHRDMAAHVSLAPIIDTCTVASLGRSELKTQAEVFVRTHVTSPTGAIAPQEDDLTSPIVLPLG